MRNEVARHPQGHLLGIPGREVELSLRLPLAGADALDAEALERRAATLRAELRAELETQLALTTAFEPGRVLNLRTGEAGGDGTLPPDGRFVFAGWTPSGVPRFLDFAQLLLERQHAEQHRLYDRPPALLTLIQDRDDLRRELLPAFAEPEASERPSLRVHGQVVAGWFVVPRADGSDATQALTLQVVSVAAGSGPRARQRRYALNVVGSGPDGEALSEVVARLDSEQLAEPPWQHAVEWGQKALESLTPRQPKRKRGGRKAPKASGEVAEKRIRGILGGLARRLEQRQRSRRRRTGHAERRHRDGDRPTRMALQDLARADVDEILVDERRDTMVVLGERGRAHVFNDIGKLVTSIRYTPDSIEKKRRLDIWRPASREEIQSLRKTVGV